MMPSSDLLEVLMAEKPTGLRAIKFKGLSNIFADAGGRDHACVSVDQHPQADHPDSRAAAVPKAALEGARRRSYPYPRLLVAREQQAADRLCIPSWIMKHLHHRGRFVVWEVASCTVLLWHTLACMQALDEIHAGMFDGWTYEEIAEKHSEEYAARKRDKLRYRRGAIYHCLVLEFVLRWKLVFSRIASALTSCIGQQSSFGMPAAQGK